MTEGTGRAQRHQADQRDLLLVDVLPSRPLGRRELSLAALVFVALTLALTDPLSLHPGSTSLGSDPDVHTYTWTLSWGWHALLNQPLSIFDGNIFYPYDRTLGVQSVVVHTDLYGPGEWAAVERRFDLFRDRLTLKHVDGAGRVYVLTPPVTDR